MNSGKFLGTLQGQRPVNIPAHVFIHIFCRIASERDGRDRFPNGPREWWANGMPFRPQHSEFIRSDASEKRPCHGIGHDVYKAVGFNPRFAASHDESRRGATPETRLPLGTRPHQASRRDATLYSYHPWNRGLKPTATFRGGRSATGELFLFT